MAKQATATKPEAERISAPSQARARPHDLPVAGEAAAVWVDPRTLKRNPKNPRRNDAAVPGVARSIQENGFGAPLVARLANRMIIAGDTRWRASVEVLDLPLVPVRFLDITQRQANVLTVGDNKLGELAEWDEQKLADMLQDMEPAEQLLAGYGPDDIGDLLASMQGEAPEVVEDEVPEPPKVPVTQLGDVWLLGRHRLVCGDSTQPEVLARLLDGARPALLTTDPPYGVAVVGGSHDPRARSYQSGERIQNDELAGAELEAFLRRGFSATAAVLAPGAAFYVWYGEREALSFLKASEALGGYRHILVWVKPAFVFGRADYHYRHESCFYGWRDDGAHTWLGDRKQTSVIETGRDEAVPEGRHPTVKPVELYARAIRNHLRAEEAVLDTFAGSGPAFSAAEQLNRTCFGIELSPAYCDVIVERWQALTGEKAKRA